MTIASFGVSAKLDELITKLRTNGVNPSGGNHHRLTGLEMNPNARFGIVGKERVALLFRYAPLFVFRKILLSRLNHVKDLFARQDVIEYRCSAKVNMKIGKASG